MVLGKCNRGLMVAGSLRHLVSEREKVWDDNRHLNVSRFGMIFNTLNSGS